MDKHEIRAEVGPEYLGAFGFADLDSQAVHEQFVAYLAAEHADVLKQAVEALEEYGHEVGYHDPQVGIRGDQGQANAAFALAAILGAEVAK